ncbi:methyltransferase domain-containing protein [Pseudoflavitalea sp. G-6-1-2]|uniref:methyltransferase domain-containing protein n=1 Tax=Pseudoflavitalea sp. G-6-1-2 TaxID=2728841 RepID=UPI00198168F7|nr:methyltransferase domain-containing protein [Pseudoflavitalea sp. G-6-1-2]
MRQRSLQLELLDQPDIPAEDIRRNMYELNIINTWLGGHAITIAGIKKLLSGKKRISICEIGCGGGDNLLAIAGWCMRNGIEASFTGIDINRWCIETAQEKWQQQSVMPGIEKPQFIVSDYRLAQFSTKPDIIFSSLFCHHFTNEELVQQLQWMQRNASTGFFINDLHRHRVAEFSIRLLTRLFSRSYLVRHDAPLSVKRSFVKNDWKDLFQQAGFSNFSVQWKWAFRWLVTVINN